MSEIKTFLLTKSIIQESEKNLLESFKPTFRSIDQDYRLPAGYMLLGFKELFKLLGKFIKILLLTIIAIFIYNLFINMKLENIILVIATFTSLVFFAIPSTYAFYGIENKHIEKIVSILYQKNIKTTDILESIENNINIIHSRTNERIKALRWIVSSSWLVYTIFIKQFIVEFNKQSNININDFSIANIEITTQMLIYILVAIIVIVAYKKGMDFLFNTIKFSINEYKIILKKETNTKPRCSSYFKLANKCITKQRRGMRL